MRWPPKWCNRQKSSRCRRTGARVDPMLDRLAGLEAEYEQVVARMNDPAVLTDQHALRDTGRPMKELEPAVAAYRQYKAAYEDLAAAKETASGATGDERD